MHSSPGLAADVTAERARRQVTLAAYATFAIYGAAMNSVGPTLEPIARDFGVTLGRTGDLFFFGGIGFLLVVFLAGYVADRVGKRAVLLAGIVGALAGLAGQSAAFAFAVLLIAALVANVGNGLLESSVGGLVADVHSERRTPALNLLHSFFGIGAFVGPMVGGALVLASGWRAVYVAFALAFVALLGYVLALRRHFPSPSAEEPIHWRETVPLLRSRTVQLGMLGIFLYVAGELSLSAWGVPYLERYRGADKLTASFAVSLFWATIALGRAGSAWVSAHLRPERLLQASAGLSAAGAVLLLLAPGILLSLVGFAIAGLGAAAVYPTIMALSTARFPRLTGSVTGLITTATGLGIVFGPMLVGRLGDAFGLEQALYGVVAAMATIALLYAVPARS